MCDSGIDDFARADDLTLCEGMRRGGARSGSRSPCTPRATRSRPGSRRARSRGRTDRHARLPGLAAGRSPSSRRSRARSLLAEEAGCALHVVHVSTGRGVALVAEARARGVDVTLRDLPALPGARPRRTPSGSARSRSARRRCARPAEREALWRRSQPATLPMVASDHSPSPPELKEGDAVRRPGAGSPGARRCWRCSSATAASRPRRALPSGSPGSRRGASGWPGKGGSRSAPTRISLLVDRRATAVLSAERAALPPPPQPVRRADRCAPASCGPCVRGRTVSGRPDRRRPAGRLVVPQ